MSKFLLFGLLWWVFGNPFIAIIVLLIVLYMLERRFIGLSPSLVRPLRRRGAIRKWERHLQLSPHDVSARTELARLLIESGKHRRALELLRGIERQMENSAEYWSDCGVCLLEEGRTAEGEQAVLRAIGLNPKVKYGQPLLRLAESFATAEPAKAEAYVRQFREINSSSCEAQYRLGVIYTAMGRRDEAAAAFRACLPLYRSLPKYMKRRERPWLLRCWWRGLK